MALICVVINRLQSMGGREANYIYFRFHRFEVDRTISFIPPDGEFELMSYRLNTHVSFLILSMSKIISIPSHIILLN